ncbi:MAG: TonB-dependent receptor [Gammaproteobacteria bacterium]|nr:TonB-dependent receptor [Gammaproteobacteria bacterium]
MLDDFRSATLHLVAAFAIGLASSHCIAETEANEEDPKTKDRIEQVLVIGNSESIAGSHDSIQTDELDQFDYSDLHQVLAVVPGVYVKEEDGYGLRPNIGIRGAAANRSSKVTLMEDGVLVAPAPYSAPSAYYVPNISRMSGVEVLKGPAAIQTGPHTIGGAVNLLTREVPNESLQEIDVSYGSNAFYKVQGAFGGPLGDSNVNVLLEGLSYGTEGFKELDTGEDTGFHRNDICLKLRWQPTNDDNQQLTVKFAFADEDSHETYLGLTDADFRAHPTRRYSASKLARFNSDHYNIHVNYGVAVENVLFNFKAYVNRFERDWNKLGSFFKGASLQAILTNPLEFPQEYALLVGTVDSMPIDSQTFKVTGADRTFDSNGVQGTATVTADWGAAQHLLTIAIRLHRDTVRRNSRPRGYLMTGGDLVWDGVERSLSGWRRARSDANAIYIADEISWGDFSFNAGVRVESIDGEYNDLLKQSNRENDQSVVSPGGGLVWQVNDTLALLAGVYKGFSPAGPGATDIDPERSLNFEAGLRLDQPNLQLEALRFQSNYDNLLGRCRVSDVRCEVGQSFNGGEVDISGLEFSANSWHDLVNGLRIESGLTYTYTQSAFLTSFLSSFSQWGSVEENDDLPYLPKHRAQLHLGLSHGAWEIDLALRQQAAMREEPGNGPVEQGLHADSVSTVDVTTSWQIREQTLVQLILGNLLNEQAIVAHRPLGARPNRPRWFSLRVRNRF